MILNSRKLGYLRQQGARAIHRFWPLFLWVALLSLGYGLERNAAPACLIKKVTGYPCPGCGMLRSTHALLHGHIGQAFEIHPLTPILLLLLPLLTLFQVASPFSSKISAIKNRLTLGRRGAILLYLLIIIGIVLWEYRQIRLGL